MPYFNEVTETYVNVRNALNVSVLYMKNDIYHVTIQCYNTYLIHVADDGIHWGKQTLISLPKYA